MGTSDVDEKAAPTTADGGVAPAGIPGGVAERPRSDLDRGGGRGGVERVGWEWATGGLGFGLRGHIGQGRLGGSVGLASWAGAQWRGSFLLLFLFYFLYFPFTVLL